MAQWRDLPVEVSHIILRFFCISIVKQFSSYPPRKHPWNARKLWKVAMTYPIPIPLSVFLSVLCTCKHFHHFITVEFTFRTGDLFVDEDYAGFSTMQVLQSLQSNMVEDIVYDMVRHRLHQRHITFLRAMFGKFWKSEFVLDDEDLLSEILRRLPDQSQTVLVCLLQEWLSLHAGDRDLAHRRRYERTPNIVGVSLGVDRTLYFSRGSLEFKWNIEGDFYTVSDVVIDGSTADSIGSNLFDSSSIEYSNDINPIHITPNTLPSICFDAPDTWWLFHLKGMSKRWFLVNYTNKCVFSGPDGNRRVFVGDCDLVDPWATFPEEWNEPMDGESDWDTDTDSEAEDSYPSYVWDAVHQSWRVSWLARS
jgi:hypothetical protein